MEIVQINNPFYDYLKNTDNIQMYKYKFQYEEICYFIFEPTNPTKNTIIYLHGMQSHQGWFFEFADLLCKAGIRVITFDRPGSGISKKVQTATYKYKFNINFLYEFINTFRKKYKNSNITLMGNSYGAKIALASILYYDMQNINIILTAPGLFINQKIRLPFNLIKFIFSKGETLFPSLIKETNKDQGASIFTSNEKYFNLIVHDNLSKRFFSKQFYLETKKLDLFILRNLKKRKLIHPILVFFADQDPIMDNEKTINILTKHFNNFRYQIQNQKHPGDHMVLFSDDRYEILEKIKKFILK